MGALGGLLGGLKVSKAWGLGFRVEGIWFRV